MILCKHWLPERVCPRCATGLTPNVVVGTRGMMTADMQRAFDETRERVLKMVGEKQ